MKDYVVVKQALDPKIAEFVYDYFLMKRQVAKTKYDNGAPITEEYGVWSDPHVPDTYSHYADIVMETLLRRLKPLMERETGLNLNETYSYARIYKKGDVLHRHKDRFSCEISTTMNIGGDPWPIFIEPNIKVDLGVGDMLVYRGCDLEHWRDEFDGDNCGQVFLHYNNTETKGSDENLYDGREHLGLPSHFKKRPTTTTSGLKFNFN